MDRAGTPLRRSPAAGASCVVCDAELPPSAAMLPGGCDQPTCRAAECRWVMSHRSLMQPAQFQLHLESQRRSLRHRRAEAAFRTERVETITAQEALEDQRILQTVATQAAGDARPIDRVVAIPSGLDELVPVPAQRRERYAVHLRAIIAQAAEAAEGSLLESDHRPDPHQELQALEQRFAQSPGLRTVCDRVCGICRGGCCAHGEDEAYLSVATMRRRLDARPELSAEDLAADYLARIPAASIAGACINQTATGCALPRDLRSDICNRFYCDPLKAYMEACSEHDEPGRLLVIQRSHTQFDRFDSAEGNQVLAVAVVEEVGIQPLPLAIGNSRLLDKDQQDSSRIDEVDEQV